MVEIEQEEPGGDKRPVRGVDVDLVDSRFDQRLLDLAGVDPVAELDLGIDFELALADVGEPLDGGGGVFLDLSDVKGFSAPVTFDDRDHVRLL